MHRLSGIKRVAVPIAVVLLLGTLLMACGGKSGQPGATATTDTKKELSSVTETTSYEGSDREQLLLEGAKKEGAINFYTSIAENDLAKLIGDFEKKYGIKVNSWRSGTDQVLQRIVAESRAGKNSFDLVHISGPEMEALYREKLLQPVKSPHFKDLIPGAVLPHREWTLTMLTVYVQAYNTKLVKREELPKTYQDLLDPKWKGKLGIEEKDFDWFLSAVQTMGEEKGLQLFRNVVKTNGISVRKGHSLLNNFVISGEVPLALTLYHYMPEQAKQKGAPIDWFILEEGFARANGVGISKKAPHPNAAMLFYDYLLSDAQKLLVDMNYIPANAKLESPLKNIKLTMIDSAKIFDESAKWSKLFDDVFVNRK